MKNALILSFALAISAGAVGAAGVERALIADLAAAPTAPAEMARAKDRISAFFMWSPSNASWKLPQRPCLMHCRGPESRFGQASPLRAGLAGVTSSNCGWPKLWFRKAVKSL